MINKVLWVDCETTGLSDDCGIIQLSALMEINGKVVDKINLKMNPDDVSYEKEAIEKHCISIDEIETYMDHEESLELFLNFLDLYLNKYDRKDKAVLAGYNVSFDERFIKNWFLRNKKEYWYSYVFPNAHLDVYRLLPIWEHMFEFPTLDNRRLETLCEWVEVEIVAHDALEDIIATREVFYRMKLLV